MEDSCKRFRLDGRVAIVTGASSGLGVVFARALAGAGARVALAARRKAQLESLARELETQGASALAVSCDVTQEEEVDALVAATLRHFGRADILINNAGMTTITPAELQPAPDFRRTIEVDLIGAFLCAQRFARVMLAAGGGSIVNVASVLGMVGVGQVPQAAYAAAKGGIINLTRELAAQWARRGIRVNALAPGWFPSEMTAELFSDERSMKWARGRTPMGRTGDPEELVGPVLFLASDASSFVTGQTLAVDGGWSIV